MATDVVLRADHVVKSFRIHQQRTTSLKQLIAAGGRNKYTAFIAVNDLSFDVREGEVFGVIGQNGSGKSTLLKCMAGILRPNSGSIAVHRRLSALLELGAGFHPELTGRENVFLNAAILGMRRKDITSRFEEIVEFSGLRQFLRIVGVAGHPVAEAEDSPAVAVHQFAESRVPFFSIPQF